MTGSAFAMPKVDSAGVGASSAVLERRGPLRLGLFMPNCSNAYSISTYKPVPDDWTYESNAQIAHAAEAAGFDFLFPVAKWKDATAARPTISAPRSRL